jgi:hypothetical protein
VTPERWDRIKRIFAAAIDVEPGSRGQYVRDASAGDAELYAEVQSLLEADSEQTLLRNPILPPPSAAATAESALPAPDAPSSSFPRFNLRFQRDLETQYAREYFASSLPRVRGALVLGIFLYAIFGLLDQRVAPEQTRLLGFIRFAIVCPFGAILLAYSFVSSFERHWQLLVATLVLLATAGFIVMIMAMPAPASYLYSTGFVLIIIFYSTLVRLAFAYAVSLSVVIIVAYNAAIAGGTMPFIAVLTTDMMIVAAVTISLSANLALERHNRREFIYRREIAARTSALESKNQELAAANLELLRSREEIMRSAEKNELLFAALTEALPGTVLDGKYRLDEKIGAGGFGTVYRGFHLLLQRAVAVKLLKPTGGDLQVDIALFRREGIEACRLNHPNAVTVLDFGVAAGSVGYLVMELLEGRSLAQELDEHGPLTLDRCCEVIAPLCAVLAEAHRTGLVHRDLKPSNVFLHRHAGGEVVKIIDFGLATRVDPARTARGGPVTLTTGLRGTPEYMAPERLVGGDCDPRADVYSLGVMAYEMLSGKRPFDNGAAGRWALAFTRASEAPASPHLTDRLVPEAIAEIIHRTLARDPARRPTAEEFGLAFAAAADLAG